MNPEQIQKLSLELGLCYEQSIHEEQLVKEYTGRLDITAASERAEACWIMEDIVSIQVKKTLLLSTWYFEYVDDTERETLIHFFYQLLRAGHRLSINTANGLETIDNSTQLHSRLSRFVPLRATEAFQRSDTVIIDARMLQRILSTLLRKYDGDTHIPVKLSQQLEDNIAAQDSLAVTFNSPADREFWHSPTLCDKVRHITLSSFEPDNEYLEHMVHTFRYLEHIRFNRLTLSIPLLALLLQMPGLRKLSIVRCRLIHQHPLDMESLELTDILIKNSDMNTGAMFNLIRHSPRLVRLSIINCRELDDAPLDLAPGYLPHLEHLNLDETALSQQQQDALVSAAPNIRTLSPGLRKSARPELHPGARPVVLRPGGLRKDIRMEWGNNTTNPNAGSVPSSLDADWPFERLTSVCVADMRLHESRVRRILSSPVLTSLDLNNSQSTNESLLAVQDLCVPSLQTGLLNNTLIDGQGLQALFNMAPKLECLSIRHCSQLHVDAAPLILKGRRGHLDRLYASNSSLTTDQLSSILQAETNLSTLDLSRCKKVDLDKLRLKPGQLPHLISLGLNDMNISAAAFESLWQAAPNLLNLTLKKSTIALPERLKTGRLMNLSAAGSTLSARSIDTLFKANPSLVTMDISNSPLGCQLPNASETMLKDLTCLIMNGIQMTDRQLDSIICRAPGLRDLGINNRFESTLPSLSAQQLCHLRIMEVGIPAPEGQSYIFKLLEGASHLEMLDLHVYNDPGDNPVEGSLPGVHSLTICFKEDFRIGSSLVSQIIKAAPNARSIRIDMAHFRDSLPFSVQPRHLKQLRQLSIMGSDMTAEQLLSLIQAATSLKKLKLEYCSRLSQWDVNCIQSIYPDIRISRKSTASTSQPPEPGPQAQSSASSSLMHNASSSFMSGLHYTVKADSDFQAIPGIELTTRKIFSGHKGAPIISTNKYHLSTMRWDQQRRCFTPYQPDEKNIVPIAPTILPLAAIPEHFQQSDPKHYRAQKEIHGLVANVWHQLPAVSTKDRIKAFSCNLIPQDYELIKDKETGYHFFRVKTTQSRPLLFRCIIQSGFGRDTFRAEKSSRRLQRCLSRLRFDSNCHLIKSEALDTLMHKSERTRLAALEKFCTFKKESGKNWRGKHTYQLFNHMIRHREGACRHRVQLFTVLAAELNLRAYRGSNECHGFVITRQRSGKVRHIDLGGASYGTLIEQDENTSALDDYLDPMADTPATPVSTAPSRISEPAPSNRYRTWNNRPLRARDAQSLTMEILEHSQSMREQLVIFEDEDSIEAVQQALLRHHYPMGRCLYSQNLDAISLTSGRITSGTYHKVPSPIAQFISEAEQNPDQQYNWFINWSDARSRHKGLNRLVSSTRRQLGNHNLPDNLHLVVLMDRESLTNIDDEFKRDLRNRSCAPRLLPTERPIPAEKVIDEQDVVIVNPLDWKKQLFGHVNAQGRQLVLEAGALLKAIEQNADAIAIQNPPLHLAEFREFLNELEETGKFYVNGEWHRLPSGCCINLYKPVISYAIQAFDQPTASSAAVNLVINQSNYATFFERTRLDEQGMHSVPGLLEAYQQHLIRLTITQSLNKLQWVQLMKEATRLGIRLIPEPVAGVIIPDELRRYAQPLDELKAGETVRIYTGNDMDYSQKQAGDTQHTIPISKDTRFESLFIAVQPDADKHFIGHDSDLLAALKRGDSVTLKGRFSELLVRKMHSLFTGEPSLLINGERVVIRGRLILITEDEQPFAGISCQQLDYDPEYDLARLHESAQKILRECYHNLSISPCYAHFSYCPKGAHEQVIWARNLEKSLYLAAGVPLPPEPASSSSQTSVMTHQVSTPEALIDYMSTRPFGFLISESGAGKSHLMQTALPEHSKKTGNPITVYNNLSDLKKWAMHREGRTCLFLDEANISTQDYMMFDNLARGEGVIWIDGQRYELSPDQKVVFAGNPYTYGGRVQADLFRRFPNYLEFRPQPLRQMLQPLLTDLENENAVFEQIQNSMKLAQEDGLTMTVRNAFMICQRIKAMKLHPELRHFPENILLHRAILDELKGLRVDRSKVEMLRRRIKDDNLQNDPLWQANSSELKTILRQRLPKTSDNTWHWTKSREKTAIALLGFLAVREQRRLAEEPCQGINGFMLEGRGLGRGRLLKLILKETNTDFITLSLDNPAEAKRLLIHAFHHGPMVYIPAFDNRADEKLLNDLLSGIDPDKKNRPHPDFAILATHDGSVLSPALSNRFTCLNLKEDSIEELQSIIKKALNAPDPLISQHLTEYQHARDWARQEGIHLQPKAVSVLEEIKKERDTDDTATSSAGPG
ncbi:hypothetical protein [Legionella sp. CNM-4043-24]|uniref:hypothetical protein n=1 Tax=Legionella sp. CNM-4043-24 TaxID=3421646 RepID=UPI00403ADA92